jgi:NADH-quinone oxidoreductase subunit J
MAQDILFYVLAIMTLGFGFMVIANPFSRNPVTSAMFLVLTIVSLAGLFVLLHAYFLAAVQVLVYAGAVMVMFLFVIAYVGPRTESPWTGGPSWQAIGSVLAAGALLVEIVVVIGLKAGGALAHTHDVSGDFGTPSYIGRLFLTDHLLAFEITSIVLLISAIGGVILGAHSRAGAEEVPPL